MRKLLLIGLLISINQLKGISQELVAFNDKNGFLFSVQFMGLIDQPRISSVIGYKTGKIVYLAGYEVSNYNFWTPHGFMGGIQLYPHRNQKKLKIFYHALISYKWNLDDDYPRMYLLHVGGGLDYFFKKNFSIGCNFGFGIGKMKEKEYLDYSSVIDINPNLTIKYFLFSN